jgi:hypothetical protein
MQEQILAENLQFHKRGPDREIYLYTTLRETQGRHCANELVAGDVADFS